MEIDVLIIGAGLGGLTAAYKLLNQGKKIMIVEKEDEPGGYMRSVIYNDFCVDLGFKHIYSRIPEVDAFWRELLKEDLINYYPRTGILYNGYIFEKEKKYKGIRRGVPYSILISCITNMLKYKLFSGSKKSETLLDYSYLRRGKKISFIFSQAFDERLKGRKWADIKINQLIDIKTGGFKRYSFLQLYHDANKTSVNDFLWYHPVKGTGQIVKKLVQEITAYDVKIETNTTVVGMEFENNSIHKVRLKNPEGEFVVKPRFVISSLPVEKTGQLFEIRSVKNETSFKRSVILVYFFLKQKSLLKYNSIQVASPGMKISRITDYGAYLGKMVPEGKGCLCAEIFCFSDDEIMNFTNTEIIKLATDECQSSGLLKKEQCESIMVIKCPGGDPGSSWEDYVLETEKLRIYDEMKKYINLFVINRTGSDKSTYAAILAAKSICDGIKKDDFFELTRPDLFAPWMRDEKVNQNDILTEPVSSSTPKPASPQDATT